MPDCCRLLRRYSHIGQSCPLTFAMLHAQRLASLNVAFERKGSFKQTPRYHDHEAGYMSKGQMATLSTVNRQISNTRVGTFLFKLGTSAALVRPEVHRTSYTSRSLLVPSCIITNPKPNILENGDRCHFSSLMSVRHRLSYVLVTHTRILAFACHLIDQGCKQGIETGY